MPREKKDKKVPHSFDNILLKIHSPKNVIIIHTAYGTPLGYLEVTQDDQSPNMNVAQSLGAVIGKLNTLATKNNVKGDALVTKIIQHVIKKIIAKSKIKGDPDEVLRGLGPDVYLFIKRLFIEQGLDKNGKFGVKPIRARFIPSKRMVHFSLPSSDHFPYGESIVDPLVLPSKLYMITQLANVIIKLSRSALIRKWTIDTGQTQMTTDLVQKLKRELNNTRVTVEDLASFKSIPKLLSDYKDLFMFSKQGNRSVDVEVQALGDPTIKVADLEDHRREIISLSGVPAPLIKLAA